MLCYNCGEEMEHRTVPWEVIRPDGKIVTLDAQGWVCSDCGEVSLNIDEILRIRKVTYDQIQEAG